MTVVLSQGYLWIAERDRVAHAVPARGHHIRSLCGRPAPDPRFAHPAVMRCERCEATVARPVAAETEAELREAYGK